jgi:hypothetical protein
MAGGLMTDWVLFQATVPESVLPELTRLVAKATEREIAKTRPPETTEDRVERAMRKIGSVEGRTLVVKMAELALANEGCWVTWPQLHAAMGLDARQASGVLGGVNKVLKGEDLFERASWAGTTQFRMAPQVAHEVLDRGVR